MGRATRLVFALATVLCLAAPAQAWKDCLYCYRKPCPTGVTNNCFGYYPTCWRQRPAECTPCIAGGGSCHSPTMSLPAGEKLATPPAPADKPVAPPPPDALPK
jgi:hypothetical protein